MRHRFPGKNSLYVLALLPCICWPWFSYDNTPSIKAAAESGQQTGAPTGDDAFVVRSGTSLMLNGQPFRFSGANIYWLGLQDKSDGSIAYPSHFAVDDVLATASWMGDTVVRAHTLGISVGCKLCIEPALGTFNPVALQHIDYALLEARRYHIKLIIPLVDNWHYYHGGKSIFTRWRGLSDEQAFYSSPAVIHDFEDYIHTLLNHVNTYTGIAYKDDPTILAWETGNELSAPVSWVQTISTYLKQEDHHHLVMDGNYEQANEFNNFLPDLAIKTLDLYSGHYYPPTNTALQTKLQQVTRVPESRKCSSLESLTGIRIRETSFALFWRPLSTAGWLEISTGRFSHMTIPTASSITTNPLRSIIPATRLICGGACRSSLHMRMRCED